MLSYRNINTVAIYEQKTLIRSWFFKIFGILALVILTVVQVAAFMDFQTSNWLFKALPGNIPYFNLSHLNIVQSIIAVFLATGFLKRDKKYDTSVVIYTRPMSNAEYILGKTWGIFKIFMGLNIVSLIITLVINLLSPDAPFDLSMYIMYPLIISVPSIIFILGLSFFIMTLIKNQAVTFIILLSYIGLCVFYIGSKYYGITDYTSYNLPILYSDMVGFVSFKTILLHRAGYLLAGLGFIFFTVSRIERLPHKDSKVKHYIATALLFVLAGGACLYSIAMQNSENSHYREALKDIDNKYFNIPTADITDYDIALGHKGEELKCTAKMKMVNRHYEALDKIILSLNPGLKIDAVRCKGNKVNHNREEHIVILSLTSPLKQNESCDIEIDYSGNIDERVCFRDIDKDTYNANFSIITYNSEKSSSFVNKNYVLLVPETIWYPFPGIKYNSSNPVASNTYFSNYRLSVNTAPELTVLSQGTEQKTAEGATVFTTEQPLPQISLVIGEYEKKQLICDSVEINLLHYKNHDYFTPVFESIKDTIPNLIKEFKTDYEMGKNRNYPYKKLMIAEVPVQFKTYPRLWRMSRETTQPQMILYPEMGMTLPNGDIRRTVKNMMRWGGRRDGGKPDENKTKIRVFNRLINETFKESDGYSNSLERKTRSNSGFGSNSNKVAFSENIYSIDPNFFYFVNNISSRKYGAVNILFEYFLNKKKTDRYGMFRSQMGGLDGQDIANMCLKRDNFNDLLSSKDIDLMKMPAIVENKANYLYALLIKDVGEDKFKAFISKYLTENIFCSSDFEDFTASYNKAFDTDISGDIEKLYHSDKLPGFLVSDVSDNKIVDGDSQRYQLLFTVTNEQDEAGIIEVTVVPREGEGRGRRFNRRMNNTTVEYYKIDAKSAAQIGIVNNSPTSRLYINTMISMNIPSSLLIDLHLPKESNAEPFEGMRKTDMPENDSDDVIIVDNEDEGFRTEGENRNLKINRLINRQEEEALPEEKYKASMFWHPPTSWTLSARSDYYGKYIRSAYYIRKGEGKQSAIWNADIKKSGYYDIYFYLTEDNGSQFMFSRRAAVRMSVPDRNYYVTVNSDEGEKEVKVSLQNVPSDNWIYLGNYYISKGETSVKLSDKSGGGVVIADAVKWVLKK